MMIDEKMFFQLGCVIEKTLEKIEINNIDAINVHREVAAELIKKRNEIRKEELMSAVISSERSYEEILAFIRGEVVE